MKLSKIEDAMYLVRCNLYWFDEEGLHDFTNANVVSIVDDKVTLQTDCEGQRTWDIDELIDICHKLCDDHFAQIHRSING